MDKRYGAPEGSLNVVEMLDQTMKVLIERHTKYELAFDSIGYRLEMEPRQHCLIQGDRKDRGFVIMHYYSKYNTLYRSGIEKVVIALMPYERDEGDRISCDHSWYDNGSELLFTINEHGLLCEGKAAYAVDALINLLIERLPDMIARPHQAIPRTIRGSMNCNEIFSLVPAFYHPTAPIMMADIIEEVVRQEMIRYAEEKSK